MLATQRALAPGAAIKPPKDLLAGSDHTAKAQRHADWGIIKEMSRYLWPKVGGRGKRR